MARFVLANRRAGKFNETEKLPARAAADRAMDLLEPSADVIGVLNPPDLMARQVVVFEADPADVAVTAMQFSPDVILEPEILHQPAVRQPPTVIRPLDMVPADGGPTPGAILAGAGRDLLLTVVNDQQDPLANASVLLFLRAPGQSNELEELTDASGQARFSFSSFWTPSAAVITPAGDHWTMLVRGPSDGAVVVAPRLPEVGPRGWWHDALGIDEAPAGAGSGIRVGVADTGAGPHAALAHVTRVGAFIDGTHHQNPADADDVESHGTHVCGTIGARPGPPTHPVGLASGVELFAARVFPEGRGANQGDIANAIDFLSGTHQVDLINLSLGARQGSEIIRDAIQDALERGTLCICAAGNSAGPVEFPGAFDEAVAVSALGLEGWGPPGSLASIRLPAQADRFGVDGLYLANFSCFGVEVSCTAPGVGILAPVPERFGLQTPYGSMDGTSMASPAACAALAVALSSDPVYSSLKRDLTRATQARAILRRVARDIGLAATFQGFGVPRALASFS